MKKITIPNLGELTIENVIFDINGTIQFNGKIADDLLEKFKELKKIYNVYLVSSDTRGNLHDIAEKLGVDYVKICPENRTDTEAKLAELNRLGPNTTVTVGNGNNDALMLKEALLGLVILGSEGASARSIRNADVVFPDPQSAIDFLLDDKMMIATLRK